MEKHDFIRMLNCRLEQEQGKPASLFHCEGCRAKSFCEKEDLPSLLNRAIYELEHTIQKACGALEFATYTGHDFKHGLRHGEDYRLIIETTQSGFYNVYAKCGTMQADLLIHYYHLSEIINDWCFIQ